MGGGIGEQRCIVMHTCNPGVYKAERGDLGLSWAMEQLSRLGSYQARHLQPGCEGCTHLSECGNKAVVSSVPVNSLDPFSSCDSPGALLIPLLKSGFSG